MPRRQEGCGRIKVMQIQRSCRKKSNRCSATFTLIFGLVFTLAVCPRADAKWFDAEQAIMGTAIRVELWSDNPQHAEEAIEAVMHEMRRIDDQYSPYRPDSELSRVNQLAAKEKVPISREFFALIQRALKFSRLSDGAFDVTFASVGYLYDYRKKRAPSQKQIDSALPGVNYRNIKLATTSQSIRFTQPGVRIDLGGIAKGYAVDRGIMILQDLGITHALVTAGGDTRIMGDRRGRPWLTGIRDPRQGKETAVLLPLTDSAISTSGDYERYFIRDGVRFHHILSPDTGKPARGSRSVSVLGPDATTTDALSTTVFVLGPKKGLALIERLPGIEAIIIDAKGLLHYSKGLQPPEPAAMDRAEKP